MSAQTHLTRHDSLDVPATLDSPRAKLVYLFLQSSGESSVDEIQSSLDMQKLALFSVLDTLAGEGLVTERDDTYAVA